MKTYQSILTAAMLVSVAALAFGQDVVEVQIPAASSAYLNAKQEAGAVGNEDRARKTAVFTDALTRIASPYERFHIIFWELSFLYSEDNQYQACLGILKRGQDEGLFYPFMVGERQWPEYIEKLRGLGGFDSFMAKNDQLKQEAQKNATFEYAVVLPAGYKKDRQYPLLVALHGGFGSHIQSTESWKSGRLDSEFVVAVVQGTDFRGSFLRSYTRDDMAKIAEAYRQVVQDYSIDTSRVIIAGPSAGGARAIVLAQERMMPAAGLILAFPMRPQSLDEQKLDSLAKTGIRAAFLCGEFDNAIKQQKEMGVIFDKHNIPNRFIVASGVGHEFPPDFAKELDRSLAFIFDHE